MKSALTASALILALAGGAVAQGLDEDFESGGFGRVAPPPTAMPAPAPMAAPAQPAMAPSMAATQPIPMPGDGDDEGKASAAFLKTLADLQKQLQIVEATQKLLEAKSKVAELQGTLEENGGTVGGIPDTGTILRDNTAKETDPIVLMVRGVGDQLVARVRTNLRTEVTVAAGDVIPGGYVVRSVGRGGIDVLTPAGKVKQLAFGTSNSGGLAPAQAQAGANAALAAGGQLGALPLPEPNLGAPQGAF